MSRAGVLAAGRRAATAGMTSTVVVYEVTSERNEATGLYDDVTATVYLGPGKIQFFDSAYEQTPVAGAHTFVVGRSFLHLPHDVEGLSVNLMVSVNEDPFTPQLLGHTWRITNVPIKSQATALRLPIEEVVA